MKKAIAFLLVVAATSLNAQDTSSGSAPLSFSAYADVYYQYDVSRPGNHTRPAFVYSYNKTNEVSVNLAFIKASYTTQKVRFNLAFMTGTYANANLANEPGLLKTIFETSIGLKLSKRADLWLDAGVLPSHIGFESAIRKDCWTLTRSILADNSPYYETGVHMSYKTASKKWYFALLFLNGWQRIEQVERNHTPAFGTQVTFTPSETLTVNSSTYAGNEYPDSISRWRLFHNFYSTLQLSKVWGITVGFDAGIQQRVKGSRTTDPWYGAAVLLRCAPVQSWSLTGRWEYYNDKYGVIIPAVGNQAFTIQGTSLNVDYRVAKNLLWCLEGKLLWAAEPVIVVGNDLRRASPTITTSLCFSINR